MARAGHAVSAERRAHARRLGTVPDRVGLLPRLRAAWPAALLAQGRASRGPRGRRAARAGRSHVPRRLVATGRTRSCCSAIRSTPTRSRPRCASTSSEQRDTAVPPGETVANFEEYTRLYRESWSEPHIRWLFSTVPVVDGVRRPRRARRLEHVAEVGRRHPQRGLVGRAHRRRLRDLLALPAHGQPVARATWQTTRSTVSCAGPTTAGRCWPSSPSAPTARCRARAGATAATSAARA